jgi:hypothetical protein
MLYNNWDNIFNYMYTASTNFSFLTTKNFK